MTNHLLEIIVALARAEVKFIVCGGVAVVLHGVERMTMDLDLSVDMRKDNIEKLLSVLKKQNLFPRAPVPAEILLDKEKIETIVKEKNALVFTFVDPNLPFRQVDVFITKENDFDALKPYQTEIVLGGETISVISKEKLIEMKKKIQPPRDKDIWDIKALM